MRVRAPSAEDPRPALSARESARPVAAALRPGAKQVQPGRARAPFNAQDPAEGAGRASFAGRGLGSPGPTPSYPRPPLQRVPSTLLGLPRCRAGQCGAPSLESPSHANPDQTSARYAQCQAGGSQALSSASPPAAPQKGGETGLAALR